MRRIVVSLTTYPARIDTVAGVIEPMFHQTVLPDEVQLWLTKEEFPEGDKGLPDNLVQLQERGLKIQFSDDNLRPHNKYFWAMQQCPDDILITVDDDIVYPLTLIQSLLEMHYRHPDAVVANRTHMATALASGELKPYEQWILEQNDSTDEPRHDLLATGVGGVLYPPHILSDGLFDKELIRKTCLRTDDLWLMIHELVNDVAIVNTFGRFQLRYVPGTQETGLFHENLDNGNNNVDLKALFEEFPQAEERFLASIVRKDEPAPAVSEGKRSRFFGRSKR